MDAQPTAPPVVAVVVAHDPGPWFEESLAAFREQDYPNLSVLVIDAASTTDLTSRVAAILPSAYVRRIDENAGFGAAANEVLEIVEGASHFVFAHDDAAPDPDAIRLMVEESYRSNAAIVAPKMVEWSHPEVLVSVGLSADVTGVPVSFTEKDELDQEQHDSVRDVFVAPGGFTLVRADLFETLQGFDRSISFFGEDLDLSWRAQVAGARVVVAPAARVRHREAMFAGERPIPVTGGAAPQSARDAIRPLQLRHRLRAILKNYGGLMLVSVLVRLAVINIVEVVYGTVSGHRRTAAAIANAWLWNARHMSDLRPLRRDAQAVRSLPDREVHRLQTRGSARFRAFLRGQLSTHGPARALAGAADAFEALRRSEVRFVIAVYAAVGVIVAIGSRELIADGVPAIRDFAAFPESGTALVRGYFSGWRNSGLGSEAPAPPAFALLGFAGWALLGATGLLRTLVYVGPLALGLIGIARIGAVTGSTRVRIVMVAAYAAVPVGYSAIANGSLGGVIAYGAAPWIVARLARVGGLEPFPLDDSFVRGAARLALIVALAVALSPAVAGTFAVTVLACSLAALLTGRPAAAGRIAGGGVVGAAGALVLLFPWSFELIPPATGWGILGAGPGPVNAHTLADVVLFRVGPVGSGYLAGGLLAAMLFAVVVGNDWRYRWAVRAWVLAVVPWAVAWAGTRGWLGIPSFDLLPLLAPAAVAVAIAISMGVAAFETDLRGFHFGVRQVLAIASLVAAVAGALPVLGAMLDGSWYAPGRDYPQLLSWMEGERGDGAFRVLWIGRPEVLPLDGWRLGDGLSYGTSREGPPDVTEKWAPSEGRSGLLADAVAIARRGETSRLGRLLAPMGVRYIALPTRLAPDSDRVTRSIPADLVETLRSQIDLREIATDESITVYENASWVPARAALTADAAKASEATAAEAYRAGGAAGVPVLRGASGPTSYLGEVPANGTVHVAEAASARWRLTVDGQAASRRTSFGWANAFETEEGGAARLQFRTPPLRWLAILLQLVFIAVALRLSLRRREVTA